MSTLKLDFATFTAKAKEKFGDRVYDDFLRRFAYGTDASCYRYIPRVVVKAVCENDIKEIYALANECGTPVTFRAAGTSLSGQACTDSVLVIANAHWQDIKVSDDLSSIVLDCGVIGADANVALKPFGKKIGPDPATINNAMIGGIFNNNSSGMCCGVKQNSYNTIKAVRIIMRDGTVLDTSTRAKPEESLTNYIKTHEKEVNDLLELRKTILADEELCKLIRRKFAIKNTTGYSINALLDFDNIEDILNHIFIGSEGTLGFTSKVEYECVDDYAYKVCALLFYESLGVASRAVQLLAANDDIVSSAELMDYSCLKAAVNMEGVPEEIKNANVGECALLVQLEDATQEALDAKIAKITKLLEEIPSRYGTNFVSDPKVMENNWKIRKSLLPLAGSLRKSCTTVITEDICYEIPYFAKGMEDVTELFAKHKFDGIIFGHALAGNVHFIITPNLSDEEESKRFAAFMEDLVDAVTKYSGSTKAEHGTGRMVAPFVEKEWGKKAYEINVAIKKIFDPEGIINPDVIITNDPQIHAKNFKKSDQVEDFIDKCMECGFCEKACPSRELTLTPRQRITVRREIVRLENMNHRPPQEDQELAQLKAGYDYLGLETCAECSMCSTLCPLEIDTANIAKQLRPFTHGKFKKLISEATANNFATFNSMNKAAIKFSQVAKSVMGEKLVSKISNSVAHSVEGMPYVPTSLPNANNYAMTDKQNGGEVKVLYFSSCANRVFKPNSKMRHQRSLQEAFESVCKKAKVDIIYPDNLKNLCCAKSYADYPEIAKRKSDQMLTALKAMLDKDPSMIVVCDHSACSYDVIQKFKQANLNYQVMDMPVFLEKVVLSKLKITKVNEDIAIYPMCATRKGKWDGSLMSIAKQCTDGKVYLHEATKCCGFAGQKGFTCPELNKSALRLLKDYYAKEQQDNSKLMRGFSTSTTCEIGLNEKTDIAWQNLVYLVDEVSSQA